MKKMLSMVAASVTVMMLSSGCSTKMEMSAHTEGDQTICKTAIFVGHKSSEEVMHAIELAGKEHGWRMTPFKSNAIIAEKQIDGKTVATTIKFEKEHISCGSKDIAKDDLKKLRDAIVKELKKEGLDH